MMHWCGLRRLRRAGIAGLGLCLAGCYAIAQSAGQSAAQTQLAAGMQDVARGNCATAETELRAALKVNPSLAAAQGLLGICEKRMGTAGALAHLEAGFAKVSEAKLRTEIGVELADDYYQRGDLEHTLPIVRTLVALNPENIDILFFAQNVYQDMADDTMNKLALLAPESPRIQEVVAERLVMAGDLEDAADHYRAALAKDPYLPGAHFELAEAILEANANDPAAQAGAQQELEQALRVDGESARLECEMGRVAYLQANLDGALAHYERARQMMPANVEALMGVARILMRQEKAGEALPLLAQAADEDPLNGEAHYRYAMALKAVGRTQEAHDQIAMYRTIRSSHDKVAQVYGEMNRRVKAGEEDPDGAAQP